MTSNEQRLSYEESCNRLRSLDLIEESEGPPLPAQLPRFNDENPGVSFFRTFLDSCDLAHLTLPRTFFGRSEVKSVSFRNSDLRESSLCWNDFIEVDFSSASLRDSDLRASEFVAVNFADADLSGADLRRSSFRGCTFHGAQLARALLTQSQAQVLPLSHEQLAAVSIQTSDGPEPDGG